MNEKNQKIVNKVIRRLLSRNYPMDLLKSLEMLEDYTISRHLYYDEEIVTKHIPFLKGTGYNFSKIRTLRKDIRQELVEQINARAELDIPKYYDIGILMLALKYVSHSSEGLKGLHQKDDKIRYCEFFIEKMERVCIGRETLKIAMKALKFI